MRIVGGAFWSVVLSFWQIIAAQLVDLLVSSSISYSVNSQRQAEATSMLDWYQMHSTLFLSDKRQAGLTTLLS